MCSVADRQVKAQWPDQTGTDGPDSSFTCLSHAAAHRQAEMDMVQIEISYGTAQNGKDYSRISKCLWQLNIFCYRVGRRDRPLQHFSPPQLNMLVILSAAFSASSATKTGSRWTCKIFHFACPNINVSIYNKIKIAPFTEDIFKFEYSAAGGSKGTERSSSLIDPWQSIQSWVLSHQSHPD